MRHRHRRRLGFLIIATASMSFVRCTGDPPLPVIVVHDDDGGGSPADTGAGNDGGGTTSDGGDGATTIRFCAQQPKHDFCDDFDDDGRQSATTGWSSDADAAASSLLSLDSVVARSAPRSLVLTTPTIGQGVILSSALTLDVPNTASFPATLRVAFDMRIAQLASTNAYLIPVRVRFGGSNTGVGVSLLQGTTTKFFEENPAGDGGPTSTQGGTGPLITLGEWQRVELTIEREAKSMSIKFDNVGATEKLTLAKIVGPVHLDLGAPVLGGAATKWIVNFDNVTVDVLNQ